METQHDNRTDRILESLTGLQKAVAPDFFYTRLLGRMQRETETIKHQSLVLRPAFVTGLLTVFLLVNIFFLVRWNRPVQQDMVKHTEEKGNIESVAKAFDLQTTTVYE